MRKKISIACLIITCIAGFIACGPGPAKQADPPNEEAGTPVTVTHITIGPVKETVQLNAISSFQLKSFVKANANGYLQKVNTSLGRFVSKGQELFVIKTKEASALGNTINFLDTSFRFSGVIHIKSPGSGYVSALNFVEGDYVADGEQLAIINDVNSFVFLMEMPYELRPYLANNKIIPIQLPDSSILNGHLASAMPMVDPTAQTQSIVIRINENKQIPENLIGKASLVKNYKENAVLLPKQAVLGNETQTGFWIMMLKDSVTAVKVPIVKGMETDNKVEILSPPLSVNDKILLTGNYGLADTARVMVVE